MRTRLPRLPNPASRPTTLRSRPYLIPYQAEALEPAWPRTWKTYLHALGPGLMAGLADNDPAGVASYAIAGATAGFAQLWLIVLATFMVQAVQVTSARLGDVTDRGLLALAERRYGRVLAAGVARTPSSPTKRPSWPTPRRSAPWPSSSPASTGGGSSCRRRCS